MDKIVKVFVTDNHKKKAQRLGDLLISGAIPQATLPNHSKGFDSVQRRFDKERYVRYIHSPSYDDLISKPRIVYVGD